MGNKVTGDKNVLLLGLSGAGKTHMVYSRLVGEGGMQTIKKLNSTTGFNFEQVETVACNLNVWDIGGPQELIHTWRGLYLKQIPVVGLLYVVNLATPHSEILSSTQTFLQLVRDELLDAPTPIGLVFNLHTTSHTSLDPHLA